MPFSIFLTLTEGWNFDLAMISALSRSSNSSMPVRYTNSGTIYLFLFSSDFIESRSINKG